MEAQRIHPPAPQTLPRILESESPTATRPTVVDLDRAELPPLNRFADRGEARAVPPPLPERVPPAALGDRVERAQPEHPTASITGTSTSAMLTLEELFTAVKEAIDPDNLIGDFRSGEIPAEYLASEVGQVYLLKIKDRMTQLQAIYDAISGMSEVWNRALERVAQSMGR